MGQFATVLPLRLAGKEAWLRLEGEDDGEGMLVKLAILDLNRLEESPFYMSRKEGMIGTKLC